MQVTITNLVKNKHECSMNTMISDSKLHFTETGDVGTRKLFYFP